jgi:prolyl-tRNA synthetase
MTHSDNEGLILPPKLAPIQVVIVPIAKNEEQLAAVRAHMQPLMDELKAKGIRLKFDDADNRTPGWKFAEYEMKGVPVRIAVGPRDLENNTVELARRDERTKEVKSMDGLAAGIEQLLVEIQENLYKRSIQLRETMITPVDTYEDFKKVLSEKGGFIAAHWDGTSETEEAIKTETKATIRCIPLDQVAEDGVCIYSGKPSKGRVLFAMAY